MNMKLISMTDFVLQIEKHKPFEPFKEAVDTYIERFWLINKYANFLKQPLTLGMFVPCDEKWNVLEEPIEQIGGVELYSKRYNEAKESVLFEGFSLCDRIDKEDLNEKNLCIVCNDVHFSFSILKEKNIEYLVIENLTLIESAIKQINL